MTDQERVQAEMQDLALRMRKLEDQLISTLTRVEEQNKTIRSLQEVVGNMLDEPEPQKSLGLVSLVQDMIAAGKMLVAEGVMQDMATAVGFTSMIAREMVQHGK